VSDGSPGRIVIVEDDAAIAEGLALNLGILKYQTDVVTDGEAAPEHIARSRPDLVLLDISLPKQSGIWVLEQLRGNDDHVPVIVLSARQDEFDKVAALRLGADDYVTKPFALAELMARVDAVLRRARRARAPARIPERTTDGAAAGGATEEVTRRRPLLRFGDIVIDLDSRTVSRGAEPVRLTHLEFELLTFLCRNDRRVFSRTQLLREVWGGLQVGRARTVDNFMAQLRAKLEANPDKPKHLVTVRGSGYRFEA
jgi:two-component system response regulator RegX3